MNFTGRARNSGNSQTQYESAANHDSLRWYGLLTNCYEVISYVLTFIRHEHGTSVITHTIWHFACNHHLQPLVIIIKTA